MMNLLFFIYFFLLVPFWNCCQFDLTGIAWGIWAGGIVEGSGGIEGNDCRAPDSEGAGESVGSVEPCQLERDSTFDEHP